MKINPNGFREYDARWIFEKDIDLDGITDLGKGLGTQIIKHTKKIFNSIIENSIIGQDTQVLNADFKNSMIGNNCKYDGNYKSINIGDFSELI